jgi:hypothetical protein
LFEHLPPPPRRDLGSGPAAEGPAPFPLPPAPAAASHPTAPSPPVPRPEPPDQLELDSHRSASPHAFEDGADGSEEPATPQATRVATFGERLVAGLEDLALHGAVLLIVLAGTALAGIPLASAPRGPWLLFLAVFSLLYTTISLAFWGASPGMARHRLVARNEGGAPLTFTQTVRRWLASVLTLVLLGLPSLPALWGARTLSDRLSGSWTWRQP